MERLGNIVRMTRTEGLPPDEFVPIYPPDENCIRAAMRLSNKK
jgi:hypothetical protein